MSDRWQDDAERAARVTGLLAEVARFRDEVLARDAELERDMDPWMRRRTESMVPGARKGLDASIMMALADRSAPPVEAIAQAAGEDIAYVEAVHARMKGLGRS